MEKAKSIIARIQEQNNKNNLTSETKIEILSILDIPSWAKEDELVAEMIKEEKWCFVVCRKHTQEYIDHFKPRFHKWFIYFDWTNYYIKRWKNKFICWVPIETYWSDSTEIYEIWKDSYWDLDNFSKDNFLE